MLRKLQELCAHVIIQHTTKLVLVFFATGGVFPLKVIQKPSSLVDCSNTIFLGHLSLLTPL